MSSWIPFILSRDKKTNDVIFQFEKDLKKISSQINEYNMRMSSCSRHLISWKSKFLFYSVLIYIIYLSSVLIKYKMGYLFDPWSLVPTITSPMMIIGVKNLITVYWTKQVSKCRTRIEELKKQHAYKIDKLKEATNFDKTQDLLLKFTDDAEDLEAKRKQQEEFFQQLESQTLLSLSANLNNSRQSRTIVDRLLLLIIGEDEFDVSKRYALICSTCHSHNGLAPPGELAIDVKYICPHCGKPNGVEAEEKENGKPVEEIQEKKSEDPQPTLHRRKTDTPVETTTE